MLDLNKMNSMILEDLRERMGADSPHDTSRDARIASMSANRAFDEWCDWRGFIDWGPQLRYALDHLRRLESRE